MKDINKLIRQARTNPTALSKLRAYNMRLAKRANQRLLRLERADFAYFAYDRAVHFTQTELGRNRFSANASLDYDTLRLQVKELETFLSAETSTVSGQRKIFNENIERFRQMGVKIPTGKERAFAEYLTLDAFNELKGEYIPSDLLIENIGELFEKGVSPERVQEEFNKVLTRENGTTYDIALERLGIVLR